MKKLFSSLLIAVGVSSVPIIAVAQERIPEAGIGVVAGALVGGPVGAVAGGVIGYSAGPNIRRGLGIPRHGYDHRQGYRENRPSDVR
jgi:hypothetical protein